MPKIVLAQKLSTDLIKQIFDFASYLPVGVTISSAVTTATVYSGTDASPSALISGSASISGSQVTQSITGGVIGVTYVVQCAATFSSGAVTTLSGVLAILPGVL